MMLGALVALSMTAVSCSSDSDKVEEPQIIIPNNLANEGMTFAQSGGTNYLSISANVELEVTSDAAWCSVKHVNTTANGTARYEVTTEANTTTEDRTATITIKGGGITQSMKVTQTAADGLLIEKDLFENIAAAGGTIEVKFTTNGEPSITINDNWITADQTRASMVAKTKTFSIAANRGDARTGSITFTLGTLTQTVTVKQLAGEQSGSLNFTDGDAQSIAYQLGLGWNLGNQFDAHNNGVANETAWGNPAVTQTTFEKIAAAGFTSVRIPITWMGQFGDGPSYTIDAAWLNRIAEVVGYAQAAGLKVIINMHHDGADSAYWLNIKDAASSESKNTAIKATYSALWTQIAEKFKNTGNFLVFESMNEIHDGGWGWGGNRSDGGKQYQILNEWNQLFVDVVRAVGGENTNRYLAVTGYCADPDLTMDHLVIPTDKQNRLMVAVHYYNPYEYTLNDKFSEWGHTGATGKKESYGDETDMKNYFNKLKTKYVDKGYPVYIGEMGCVHRSTERAESFRKYYLEYLCKAARTYGLAPIYWDNGATGSGKENSGLFNHATGAYINNAKDVVEVMVRGYFSDEADYTLDAVYNNAPK